MPITPTPIHRSGGFSRAARGLAPLAALLLVPGCLGRPGVQDRWSRIDLLGANVTNLQPITPGVPESLSVSADLYYRSILTGFAVADLRVSGTLAPGAVQVSPDAPRDVMASDIDQVLANSVSVGRATRAVTGWDHLIQHLDLAFSGTVPASMPAGQAPSGRPVGAFLIVYLGSGQKIERVDGGDTLIVTPFNSTAYQILPIGVSFTLPGNAIAGANR